MLMMVMAQGKLIVKRLEATENMGTIDVLCSNKTDTPTRGALLPWGAVRRTTRPAVHPVIRHAEEPGGGIVVASPSSA